MRAVQSQVQGGPAALAQLCRLYWCPIYVFARRRGHSPEDAKDKRGGNREFVSLDLEDGENRYRLELAEIEDEVHALCEALIASGGRLAP
jgi:hypothetical protein